MVSSKECLVNIVGQPDDDLDRRQFHLQPAGGVGEYDEELQERNAQVDGRSGGHAALQRGEGPPLQLSHPARPEEAQSRENVW